MHAYVCAWGLHASLWPQVRIRQLLREKLPVGFGMVHLRGVRSCNTQLVLQIKAADVCTCNTSIRRSIQYAAFSLQWCRGIRQRRPPRRGCPFHSAGKALGVTPWKRNAQRAQQGFGKLAYPSTGECAWAWPVVALTIRAIGCVCLSILVPEHRLTPRLSMYVFAVRYDAWN